MKANSLLILAVILSNLLSAQTKHVSGFLKYHENSDYIKKTENEIETSPPYNNKEGIIVTDSIYTYSGDNTEWNLSYREKMLNWNQDGNITNSIIHFYNQDNGTWGNKKDSIAVKYYNSGIKKEYVKKPWNTNLQQWGDTSLSYKYNQDGNLTETLYRAWMYDDNTFYYGFKESYTLNNDGTIASYLYHYWWDPTGEWVLEYKVTYFYNNGLLEKIVNEKLDENQHWGNYAQQIYTYDEDNIKTEILYQEWSDFDQDWRNYEKTLFTYDNNYLSTEMKYYWDIDNSNWYVYLQVLYTYNDNNDITEKISKDFFNQQWVNREVKTYTYDDNNNLTVYMHKEWDTDNSIWINNAKNEYYWSQSSNIRDIDNDNIKIFPNPVNDILYIENCENAVINIYDIKGSLINKQYLRNNSINVSSLKKGCYFIKTINNKKITTKKFIKK